MADFTEEDDTEETQQTVVLGTTGTFARTEDNTAGEETTVLDQNTYSDETTVLYGGESFAPLFSGQVNNDLFNQFGIQIDDEIVLVHSEEEI